MLCYIILYYYITILYFTKLYYKSLFPNDYDGCLLQMCGSNPYRDAEITDY